MFRLMVLSGVVMFAASAGSASAHHSYAMFDPDTTLTVSATVVKWEWTNPHTFLKVIETGTGKAWALESGSPGILSRQGLTRTTFKPGDKVTAKMHPRRDQTPVGEIMTVTLPDGKMVLNASRAAAQAQ